MRTPHPRLGGDQATPDGLKAFPNEYKGLKESAIKGSESSRPGLDETSLKERIDGTYLEAMCEDYFDGGTISPEINHEL